MPQMELERKRILFIITQSEFGGAQRFLFNFISSLDQERYDISVATGATGDKSLTRTLNDAFNISPYSFQNLHREKSLWSDVKAVLEVRSFIKRLQPDTLFLLSSKAGFIGALAAKGLKNKPKIIYRIGGWSFNDPGSAIQKLFRRGLEGLSAGWKDIIIVNNQNDFDQARYYQIKPKQQLLLIHNGLDPYKMNFMPRDQARLKILQIISSQYGKAFNAKYLIGTVANFYPSKGLVNFIEAAERFKENPDYIFCIIGEGEERWNLESRIRNYGLGKKVFLLGYIPQASEIMTALDIFVLPSLKEGFSWSLLEAMAARLPVIATRVGAAPEIIENGVNGYITDPANPSQIAEAINQITQSVDQGQSLGIEAHQTVLHKFNDTVNHKIEALL